ncbi:MAG: hypothetical protein ACPHSD_18425, partial [Candidatus Latescibacterota bacterium]
LKHLGRRQKQQNANDAKGNRAVDFLKKKLEEVATKKATKRVVALIIAAGLSGLGLSSDLAKEVGTEISQMVEF